MSASEGLAKIVQDAINQSPVGQPFRVTFPGFAGSVHIRITTRGGWVFEYTLIPGMDLALVRGDSDEIASIEITIQPHEELK